jgi:CRISPR-associated endonuclease/helicase Cas3
MPNQGDVMPPIETSTGPREYVAWGKLHRDKSTGCVSFHSVVDHMLDVANCFVALANVPAVRRAMDAAAAHPVSEVDVQRLAVLAFLHDIGKANAGFQSRRWVEPDRPPRNWPTAPFGHGGEGWALITGAVANAESVLAGLPLDDMASWGDEAAMALLQASISHHGRPIGEDSARQALCIWQPVRTADGTTLYDPADTIVSMGEALAVAFPKAFQPSQQPLPDAPAFVHLFAGLIQLADWLGSDTRDQFFPYTVIGERRIETSPLRAEHAVKAIGLDVTRWRDPLVHQPPAFGDAFGVPSARPMQSAAGDMNLGSLVVLEAETGSGKTEAALWRFLQLFQAGQVDSIFFALPTRVAASQLYNRVCDFAMRLWPVDAPVVVRALPGYESAAGSDKICLPEFKVLWSDNPDDAQAHLRWAAESPKRFLAATIAVGTIDQALLGALQVKHAHLRHAALSRSLLVVDEVHASDEYMTVLLEQLLGGHLHLGGQAMLLSATLGAAARTRYLNIGRKKAANVPSLKVASELPYPAISFRSSTKADLRAVEGNPRHKTIHWQALDAIDDPERIAALAIEAAAQGARVLVVRNTVPAAIATLNAVEQLNQTQQGDWLFKVAGTSTLHHSRFSRSDRPLLDQAVEAQLGKVRRELGGRIIIGTQTLEQSLDIDADLLITDLCPMDVLLQRLGRLHRHARPEHERPERYRDARAWVLTPADHDLSPLLKRSKHGLGPLKGTGGSIEGVYPDLRILEATRRLIAEQPSRDIPKANRLLVEHATHPEALRAIEESCGDEWCKLGQSLEGTEGARRSIAYLHRLNVSAPFDELFRGSDEKIATRLGAADRLLMFESLPNGPFGLPVSALPLRFHQVPTNVSPDEQPRDIAPLINEPGFEFALGNSRYRYSRHGLERLRQQPTGGMA